MGLVFRGLAWLVGGLIGLALLLAAGIALLVAGLSLLRQDPAGTLALPGLSAPVQIVRDGHGLPHVFAATETDAYRALGWLHAQDRPAQMELQRRLGAGRTAELVGTPGLPVDRLMRSLGLYQDAEAAYATLPAGARAAVDAYTAGVNAWLTGRQGPLPIEFWLLWHTPEPWRPADSLVYGKVMGLLGGSWRRELERAALLERLGPERLADLSPGDPPGSPVTLAGLGPDGGWVRFAAALAGLTPPPAASNWWALDGSRTMSGRPILVNDPHLGITVPAPFYLARIVTPDLTLAGAFAPGTPFLIMGHNGHVAWGFTTPYSDTEDLFVESVDPADPGRYLTEQGPQPFETQPTVIGVRFGPDVPVVLRRTRNGPVISDVNADAAAAAGPGRVVALASAALTVPDPNVQATWALNRARSRDQALAALRHYAAPHQNVVLADADGIGFISAGRIPVRQGFDGRLPVAGADGGARWTGFLPFEALPQAVDPPTGVVINANNRVVPADYPHQIGTDYEEPWRARRIADLLAGKRLFDADSQQAILADTLSLAALSLLPLLTALKPENAMQGDVLGLMRAWDGRMLAHRPEPLIFDWWLMELHRAILADELGPLYKPGLDARLLGHLIRTRPAWCDDTGTVPGAEDCTSMSLLALERTITALTDRMGPHAYFWSWGREHQAETGHALLARLPVLSWFFSRPIPTDGGHYTVNRAGGGGRGGDAPFAHVHGAVYRAIYDVGDLDRSLFVMPGGPSGDPLSPWFSSLTGLWAEGAHVPLAGSAEVLEQAGGVVLNLRPEG